jgi:hypothetical protein
MFSYDFGFRLFLLINVIRLALIRLNTPSGLVKEVVLDKV